MAGHHSHHGGRHGHGHGHGHVQDQKKDDGKRLPIPALSEYPFGGKTKLVTAIGKKYALVTVNVQNDFVGPSGALPIAGAAEVIPVINALRSTMAFDLVVHVRIAHPPKHIAFHSTSVGLHNHALGTTVALQQQHQTAQQTLWPAHCVAGTPGAAPPQELHVAATDKVVSIGTDPKADALSGFASGSGSGGGDLAKVLNDANISHVFIAGLGFGLWLGQTALDSMRDGFQTYVIADACRPLPPAPSTAGAAAGGAAGGAAAAASSGSSAAAASAAAAAAGADAAGGCDAMSVALAQGHVTVMDSSVLLLSAPPDNRRTTAERYLERHSILPLFEKLCTALVYHKPADPKAFLVEELKKLADKGRSDRVALFSDDDLTTMFAMLDPVNSGKLTAKQVAHALDSLCVKPGAVHLPQDHTYDLNAFKTKVRQGLQQS